MLYRKAERRKAKLRLAITGPAGSGKTYGALLVAFGTGGKIALLDTENGSGDLYSALGDYDICSISAPFSVNKYIEAIKEAENAGYDVLNAFIDAIINSKIHIIATIRSKTEYAQVQNEKGKAEIKKIGLGLVQHEGIDYEFTTVFDLSMEHTVTVSKDRTSLFDGQIFTLSQETGQILREWLDSGLDVPQPVNIANEKRRLYENYLRLFEYDPQNSAALAQEAMMNVVNGKRSSKDWTEEDLKNLEADLRLRDNSGLEVAV